MECGRGLSVSLCECALSMAVDAAVVLWLDVMVTDVVKYSAPRCFTSNKVKEHREQSDWDTLENLRFINKHSLTSTEH